MLILAIESSCDETSIAVVDGNKILSNVISSQFVHSKYGGVVPEIASRAHLRIINEIYHQSLKEATVSIENIDAIAVTNQPGLLGSLIVGVNFAKGLALKFNKPIIPVDHIEGHIYSGFLEDPTLKFPAIAMVVSGGHTAIFKADSFNQYTTLGLTRDDAAGEAFDKISKLLGLGYPGGPIIDKLAKLGNPQAFNFPRTMYNSNDYDFSFSGLKTSFKNFLEHNYDNHPPKEIIPDLAASVQSAIVDVLIKKVFAASDEYNIKNIVIGGGVSANSFLREQAFAKAQAENKRVVFPAITLSMDNAAMIGFLADKKLSELGGDAFRDFTFICGANSLRSKYPKKKKINLINKNYLI
ncbi:MAG TPA: tRNA (adenosine(37)-N6)-threonylcarbamoyltransferase complex transferase subunit TsaD [Bacteroidota bacterium]|nr:tRNA (adenosine(37)-N6)-threonylcarbamoyltransferase complex transferase subunit TsaD [Bacteroidota bacterium]